MVLTTPFHERLAPLNETQLWSHWSGYLSAVKYQMSDKFEYFAVRNSAGLIDTSPLYKYRIGGRDAGKFLGGVLARDIGACRDGQAQYTLWCDERGYVVEDGVVIRFAADDFILTSAEPNLAYFQKPHRVRPGRDHRRVGRLRIAGRAGSAVARDPGDARSADRARSGSSTTVPPRSAMFPCTSRAPATPATSVTRSGWAPTVPSRCGTRCRMRAPDEECCRWGRALC